MTIFDIALGVFLGIVGAFALLWLMSAADELLYRMYKGK